MSTSVIKELLNFRNLQFSRSMEDLELQWVSTDYLLICQVITFLSGLNGAKSALEVQDNLTFLDLVVQQMEHLNTTEHVDVPLLLMTSFNTEEDTLRIVKNYANRPVKITTFNQSRYPRILKESMSLLAKDVQESKTAWYPPGHGDLFNALERSGVLDRLLTEGKQYLFVSNSDNLGAVLVLYFHSFAFHHSNRRVALT
jgi:UDP-N-acetylglucosamine pyrophosphorylase